MISASGEETIADWLLARDPAWVPVLVGPPAADHAIRWMAASPTTFDDPFFAQSVERLQWTFSQMGMLDTSPSVLCSVAARLPEVEPAAIVFHISRCGSTLLVNALKRCQQVLGLSEPQPFNRITGLCASKSSYWRGESVGLARGLTSVYASISRAHPLRVVYKVSPAAVIALPYLRSIWPSVPFILLVRDPVEVVVSNLLKPPKAS